MNIIVPTVNSWKLIHDGGRYHIETSPLIMDWFLCDNGLRLERVKSCKCMKRKTKMEVLWYNVKLKTSLLSEMFLLFAHSSK